MPRYVVTKVQDALNDHALPLKGSQVLVLGAAYKPDIDDLRESPAIDVIGLLKQKGALFPTTILSYPSFQHDDWKSNPFRICLLPCCGGLRGDCH
jgi:UDP-N-acetyl-D-glucosamine dehydrogenase